MKVTVVSDTRGRILSLSVPGDVGIGPSGIARGGVLPQPGQRLDTLDVPAELESHPLADLHQHLRVQVDAQTVRLVKAAEFQEPFLKGAEIAATPSAPASPVRKRK